MAYVYGRTGQEGREEVGGDEDVWGCVGGEVEVRGWGWGGFGGVESRGGGGGGGGVGGEEFGFG